MTNGEPGWAWEVLDVDVGADARTIKRAYARLLKLNRPDDDPDAFQHLHQAYQAALAYAQYNTEAGADPASDAPLRRPATELPAPAAIAQPDSQREARDAWRDLLSADGSDPRDQLSEIFAAGQALLSFAARDAFELIALRHCADAACDDAMRDAIVEHFEWDANVSHMARMDPQAADDAIGRYRAARSHAHFHADIASNKAIEFLLADAPARDPLYLHDYGFSRQMRELTAAVRWHHPELLAYRLDAGAFDWWEQRVAGKKYFAQTAMYSAVGGAALFVLAWTLLYTTAIMQFKWSGTVLFFLSQLATFSTVALMVFRPSPMVSDTLARMGAYLAVLLHVRRFENGWQFGWMAPFACLALSMLILDPGLATRIGVGAGLFLCAAASMFAASVFLSVGRFVAVSVLAVLNACLMTSTGFSAVGYTPCLFFSVVLLTVALQHGDHLYSTLRLNDMHLTRLRVAWVGAIIAFYFLVHTFETSDATVAGGALVMLLCGVLLARAVINTYLAWAVLMAIKFAFLSSNGVNTSNFAPHMQYLGPALSVTAILMIANLFREQAD